MKKLIWMGLAALAAVAAGMGSFALIHSRLPSASPQHTPQHLSKSEELSALNARLMPANASPDERRWMNCLMSNDMVLDDGQSDASTVAQAIAAGCQSFYSQAFPHLAEAGTANQMPMAIAIVLTERKLRSR